MRIVPVPHERDRRILDVLMVDPREALALVVALEERTGATIEMVEIAHEQFDAGMQTAIVAEQIPIEAAIVIPFAALRELVAHEEQLLAGMRVHVAVEQSHVGELLPAIARHLLEIEPLPCTTSSCESGSTKFSSNA